MFRPSCYWPVYRFPLVVPLRAGKELATFEVEIYAEGFDRPTVVVSDSPACPGPGSQNAIEEIATVIFNVYLGPLLGDSVDAVRWIQHCAASDFSEAEWNEVTFQSYSPDTGFGDAEFTDSDPIRFDWDAWRARQGDVWRDHLMIVDPNDVDDTCLDFLHPSECYRRKMGVCSLDPVASPDDDPGDAGYERCRELAQFGQLWSFVYDAFGGRLPKAKDSEDPAFTSPAIILKVRPRWEALYGPTRDLKQRIGTAVALFGGRGRMPVLLGLDRPGGKMSLTDGRHRTCIARRLGCMIGAIVVTPDTPF